VFLSFLYGCQTQACGFGQAQTPGFGMVAKPRRVGLAWFPGSVHESAMVDRPRRRSGVVTEFRHPGVA